MMINQRTGQNRAVDTVGLPKVLVDKASEVESALLGSLMLTEYIDDPAEKEDIRSAAFESVVESDFYVESYRLVFRAMRKALDNHGSLAGPIVLSYAKDLGAADSMTLSTFIGLQSKAESAHDCDSYVRLVKDESKRRKVISHLEAGLRKAQSDLATGVDELLIGVEAGLSDLATSSFGQKNLVRLNEALSRNIEHIDNLYHSTDSRATVGLTTGYRDLDENLAGFQKQDLIIVAGRPSMGKTGFALNIAKNLSEAERLPCLVFSCEMPADLLSMRLLGSESMINLQEMRRGRIRENEWGSLTRAVESLGKVPIFIDEPSSLTPGGIRRQASKLVRQVGQLGLIVIDYMQLMSSGKGAVGRTQEVGDISRELKKIAREFDCPVVALSQLNRSLETRPNKRPIMSDLRESGSIEQDADVILFIYRDEVYNPDSQDRGVAEIIIGKQRNGPIGTVRLAYDSRFVKFTDYFGGGEVRGEY